MNTICKICGNTTKNGRKTCSDDCFRRSNSLTVSKTNRKYASGRMRVNNPMFNDASRLKMTESIRNIGHKPTVQGGNGRGFTTQQKRLIGALTSLGFEVVGEYVLPTGEKKGSGYPYHYKIDVAIPDKKIAIEVDGSSHKSKVIRARDIKKDTLLINKGWTVIRFWNRQIDSELDDCLNQIILSCE